MTITGAHHTGLHVGDLERSLAFYVDLLGLEVVWRRVTSAPYVQRLTGCAGAELHQAMLRVPGGEHQLELIEYRNVERTPLDPAPPGPGSAHVCLTTDDLEQLYERLIDAGVRALSEPVAVPSGPNEGALAVYVADPDGICVELVQAAARR